MGAQSNSTHEALKIFSREDQVLNPTKDTYERCLNEYVKSSAYTGNTSSSAYLQFIVHGGHEFMKKLESQHLCAGLCHRPLFSLYMPIYEGRPEEDCVRAFIRDYEDLHPVIYQACITGVLAFLTLFASVRLCCGLFIEQDATDKKNSRMRAKSLQRRERLYEMPNVRTK